MEVVTVLLLSGLTNGSVYALVGLSLAVIHSAGRVINFAQGEFVMLGAMGMALFVSTWQLPLPLGVAATVLAASAVGFLLHRFAFRPLMRRQAEPLTIMIGTFAAASMLVGAALVIWGPNQLPIPNVLSLDSITIAGITSTPQQLALIATFAVLMAAIWFVVYRTHFGLTLRAVGINADVSRLMGIRSDRIVAFTFVAGAGISALAGILVGPLLGGQVSMGVALTIKGFMAVIVGGIANPFAAACGGLAIGLIEAGIAYWGNSFYAEPILFGLILVALLVRPNGLFAGESAGSHP